LEANRAAYRKIVSHFAGFLLSVDCHILSVSNGGGGRGAAEGWLWAGHLIRYEEIYVTAYESYC